MSLRAQSSLPVFLALGMLLSTGVAYATSWVFTTNDTDPGGTDTRGKQIALGTRTVTFGGVDATDVPCNDAATDLSWSSLNGRSNGIALDPDGSRVWAGITGTAADTGCLADTGDVCLGAAWYDLSSGTLTREFHPIYSGPDAAPVDVLGDSATAVVAEKEGGEIFQWDVGDTGDIHGDADEVSQLEWVDDTFYVASETRTTAQNCTAGLPQVGTEGKIQLRRLGSGSYVDEEMVARYERGNTFTKPEGMTVVPLDPGHHGSCHAGADYVVYVGDWCESRLHAYSIDVDTGALYPERTGSTSVDLDTDRAGVASVFARDCNPSTVRYNEQSGKLYVLCQLRETILPVGISDPCRPAWARGEEKALHYLARGASDPTCDDAVTPLSNCVMNASVSCQPHDIAYDASVASDWMFVNLTSLGEVLAVRLSNLSNQYVIYKDSTEYKPYQLAIGSD